MEEDIFSRRVLVLNVSDNVVTVEIPIFESSFESYIFIKNCNTNYNFNTIIRNDIITNIKRKNKYLPITSKIKRWWYLRNLKKYNTICFEKDLEDKDNEAFNPQCKILDFILGYSIKFNSLETLYDSIYIIGRHLVSYPNLKISKDVKAYIEYRKPGESLSFSWRGNWEKKNEER